VHCIHRNCCHGYLSSVSSPSVGLETLVLITQIRYVLGVRVEGDGLYIRKVETLVSDAGDWAFNATGTAYWNSIEDWGSIPIAERDDRDVIQAAGDAYFDRFGNVNVTVSFGKAKL
jgi:hypothetical protein